MISNEEYENAFKNKDNKRIMSLIMKRFRKSIDYHDLQSCTMVALWKALAKHNPNHFSGQKFTSSLYRYCKWECLKQLKKQKTQLKTCQYNDFNIIKDNHKDKISIKHQLSLLSNSERELINKFFFEKLTNTEIGESYGCSRETIRLRIKRILLKLKSWCNS